MRGSGSRDRSGAKSYSCAWCRHSKQSQDQEKEGSICIATKCWCDADVFVNVFSQLSHVYCSLSHLLQFFPIIPVSSENDCWLFFDKGKEEASKFGVFLCFSGHAPHGPRQHQDAFGGKFCPRPSWKRSRKGWEERLQEWQPHTCRPFANKKEYDEELWGCGGCWCKFCFPFAFVSFRSVFSVFGTG